VLDSTKSGQWTLAGMGLSSFNAPVSLGVLEWTKGSAGIQSLDVRFVDAATEGESQRPYVTTLVPGLSGSGDAGSPTDTSGTTGRYTLAGLATGQNALVAAKSIGEAESGSVVSAADAIAALRLSLGMSPNPDPDGTGPLAPLPASPYQLIAADANEDGRVSAADALAVLKMAARRGDAPEREWLFVREDEDFWDHTANGGAGAWMINRNSVLYDRADKALNVSDKGATVNLVGVLKGDVNGNWAPEGTDAQTLPSTYFLGLAAELNTPIGQWGIGG
jgi:hypothetical protein